MNIALYDELELGSIRTPMGDLKVTAYHSDEEHYDLYVDLERWVDGVKEAMQVCVVTVDDYRAFPDEGVTMHVYPYNTTDEETDGCDDDLVVRTEGDRWYI